MFMLSISEDKNQFCWAEVWKELTGGFHTN